MNQDEIDRLKAAAQSAYSANKDDVQAYIEATAPFTHLIDPPAVLELIAELAEVIRQRDDARFVADKKHELIEQLQDEVRRTQALAENYMLIVDTNRWPDTAAKIIRDLKAENAALASSLTRSVEAALEKAAGVAEGWSMDIPDQETCDGSGIYMTVDGEDIAEQIRNLDPAAIVETARKGEKQ